MSDSTASRSAQQLALLFHKSMQFVATLDLDSVLDNVYKGVLEVLAAKVGSIWLVDAERQEMVCRKALGHRAEAVVGVRLKLGTGVIGRAMETRSTQIIADVSQSPFFYKGVDEKTGFATGSIICAPMVIADRVLGALEVCNKWSGEPFTQDDADLLTMLSNSAAIAIENALLHRSVAEAARLEAEVELANVVQQRILPVRLTSYPGVEMAARSVPYQYMGGDFYDVIPLGPQRFAMVMADVSGKSIAAAFYMAMTRAFLRVRAMDLVDPAPVLAQVNDLLLRDIRAEKFVTLFYGMYDVDSRELRYADAGHEPVLLLRAGQPAAEALTSPGKPLGLLPDQTYVERATALRSGDLLLLYTDGLSQARNAKSEEFGEARLGDVLLRMRDAVPHEILDAIFSTVESFAGGAVKDDRTAMVVRVT